jgi:hypothetical protein
VRRQAQRELQENLKSSSSETRRTPLSRDVARVEGVKTGDGKTGAANCEVAAQSPIPAKRDQVVVHSADPRSTAPKKEPDPLPTVEGLNQRIAIVSTPETLFVSGIGPRRWSVYGAERLQPVATRGKRGDPEMAQKAQTVAASCGRLPPGLDGKRGPAVRVRQRAFEKSLQIATYRGGLERMAHR